MGRRGKRRVSMGMVSEYGGKVSEYGDAHCFIIKNAMLRLPRNWRHPRLTSVERGHMDRR